MSISYPITTTPGQDTVVEAGAVGTTHLAAGSVTDAKIADATITYDKLANGAGVAALLTAGLGNAVAYTRTSVGALTLLALHASKDRAVLLLAICTQTFANGDGAQPTFKVGETSTTNKFWDTSTFTSMTSGTIIAIGGVNLATKNVLVTAVAGTGTTSTGAVTFVTLAIPTT